MLRSENPAQILPSLIRQRIHILDGAMGTMIQQLKLDEAAVRGKRFAGHHKDLARFSDILNLTRPDDISNIHYAYFEAGADIVETNSFGASPIGMIEFDLPLELVRDLNYAAVDCAEGSRPDDEGRSIPPTICGREYWSDHEAACDQYEGG